MGVSYANDIHPFWQGNGCTACHDGMGYEPLNLTANPATLCPIIVNGTTMTPPASPYLDNPACTAGNSEIIDIPATGLLPDGVTPHTGGGGGGTFPCFESGGNCRDTILLWCGQGAPCP